jgi:nucleotide-binding universal stress UspA family protein
VPSPRALPPRHVLVGTDGSPTATQAVQRAATVAAALRAHLTVVCVHGRMGPPPASMDGGVLGWLAADQRTGVRTSVEGAVAVPGSAVSGPVGGVPTGGVPTGGGPSGGAATGRGRSVRPSGPASPAPGAPIAHGAVAPGRPWRVTRAAEAAEIVRRAAEVARACGCRDVDTRVAAGDPASVLIRLAAELPADLLVVGSKGMRSWSRFVLGNVPDTVARHAGCDVLVVRTEGGRGATAGSPRAE